MPVFPKCLDQTESNLEPQWPKCYGKMPFLVTSVHSNGDSTQKQDKNASIWNGEDSI